MNDKVEIRTLGDLLEYVETEEKAYKLIKHINKLQSNWNSLREWLLQLKNSYIEKESIFDENKFRMILIVLDKMNELEGKDNVRINDNNDL